MRLSRDAVCQLMPLVSAGELAFEYHGTPRRGRLETLGEGPGGAFVLVRHPDGTHKSYSLAKMTGLHAAPPAAAGERENGEKEENGAAPARRRSVDSKLAATAGNDLKRAA